MLGPFTVGKGAKIGSNAVVVKPVPAGATMIGDASRMISDHHDEKGNPIVKKAADAKLQAAQVTTKKTHKPEQTSSTSATTFQAYGIEQSSQDPVAEAFAKMLEHIQQSENRLDQLQDAMCKLDPEFCKKDYDKLCLKDLDVIGDSDMDAVNAIDATAVEQK